MSHCLTAIIARTPVVNRILDDYPNLAAVDLRDDLRLIPLDDDDLDSLASDFSTINGGFNYLSPGLASLLSVQSAGGHLAYVETEYFGGMGSQAAISFGHGATLPPTPLYGDGAINQALRCIGVTSTDPGVDEFEFVGLSRHRLTSGWKEAAAS